MKVGEYMHCNNTVNEKWQIICQTQFIITVEKIKTVCKRHGIMNFKKYWYTDPTCPSHLPLNKTSHMMGWSIGLRNGMIRVVFEPATVKTLTGS